MNVYLAGPIAGYTVSGAQDWREDASYMLGEYSINAISPLRTEPKPTGRVYELSNEACALWGKKTAIAAKNRYDMDNCDITIAYLPDIQYDDTCMWLERMPSIGTMAELGYLKASNKPSILWTTEEYYMKHPVISSFVDWIVPSLEQACQLCIGLDKDYGHD